MQSDGACHISNADVEATRSHMKRTHGRALALYWLQPYPDCPPLQPNLSRQRGAPYTNIIPPAHHSTARAARRVDSRAKVTQHHLTPQRRSAHPLLATAKGGQRGWGVQQRRVLEPLRGGRMLKHPGAGGGKQLHRVAHLQPRQRMPPRSLFFSRG
eukprot:1194271-Prorocentrum_minimum.AAC.1